MRFRVIAILAVFSLLSFSGFCQDKKYQVVCAGFYNLENLFDTIDGQNLDEEFLPNGSYHYTSAVYNDKLSKLSDVISEIGTDESPDGLALMGCAEVENRVVLDGLIKQPKLAARKYRYVHYDSPDERGIDVALIYNPKYFTPTFSRPLTVNLKGLSEGDRPTRDILFVQGKLNGEVVNIFVNHWPSRRGGTEGSEPLRAKAAGVCKDAVDSLLKLNPSAKILIMGDLNDDPVSPSVAVILGAKGDTAQIKKPGIYNPWVSYYKEGVGTLAYNDSWNLFDQIMLSTGWLDKTQQGYFFDKAKIFSRPWMIQQRGHFKGYPKRTYDGNKYMGGYSDHFPTYIVLLKEKVK
jgi:hypothetical protein